MTNSSAKHENWDNGDLAPLSWRECFETGIAAIDQDHKRLFDRINQAAALLVSPGSEPAVIDILELLVIEEAAHMAAEFQALEDIGYPNMDLHREDHHTFLNKIGTLDGKTVWPTDFDALVKLVGDIKAATIDHLLRHDLEVRSYVWEQKGW